MRSYIAIPGQMGDTYSAPVVWPISTALRKRMLEHLHAPHSPEVDDLSFVMRVGGAFQAFDFEGIERLRRSKLKRYLTVDIGVPEYLWRSKTRPELARYLAQCVEDALKAFIEKLKKDKAQVEGERLMAEWEEAKAAFLEDVDSGNVPEGLKWTNPRTGESGIR